MSCVTVELQDHVLHIGLDRAAKRNAFNLQMLRELAEAYTRLEEDDDARVGLVFAHGGHFTAGLDLAEVGPAFAEGAELFPSSCVDPLQLSRKRSKPVVMALQGWCLTIGIELALAADIRLCAASTRFAQMEVQRGIMPFGGATLRFPQVAGWGNAMRWLLTGDRFDANEALRLGIVCEITNDDQLLERATHIAGRVAAQAPLAVRATRDNALLTLSEGEERAHAQLMGPARALMETEDAAEGVRSFVERRAARFTGK
jgi:enoyl-CoA hydratase